MYIFSWDCTRLAYYLIYYLLCLQCVSPIFVLGEERCGRGGTHKAAQTFCKANHRTLFATSLGAMRRKAWQWIDLSEEIGKHLLRRGWFGGPIGPIVARLYRLDLASLLRSPVCWVACFLVLGVGQNR